MLNCHPTRLMYIQSGQQLMTASYVYVYANNNNVNNYYNNNDAENNADNAKSKADNANINAYHLLVAIISIYRLYRQL